MFNIVLVHPQIPQNTGAIGRMCVNANLKLHIVKPTVFDLSEKAVRRAGLDYWKILNPKIWDSLEEFLEANLSHKDRSDKISINLTLGVRFESSLCFSFYHFSGICE